MQRAGRNFSKYGFFENRILPRVGPPLVGFGRYFGARKLDSGATFWPSLGPRGGAKKGPQDHKHDLKQFLKTKKEFPLCLRNSCLFGTPTEPLRLPGGAAAAPAPRRTCGSPQTRTTSAELPAVRSADWRCRSGETGGESRRAEQAEIAKADKEILMVKGCFKILFGFFSGRFWGPQGPRLGQNLAPGASFRTPEYRPNPANGGPIGGKHTL